jgi:hypothetical protein
VTNDSLAKAIAYLGAVEVGVGESTGVPRYAFTFGSHGRYMTAARSTVLAWWASHDYQPPTNGSTPCGVLMPDWWSPEQKFALKKDTGDIVRTFADIEAARVSRSSAIVGTYGIVSYYVVTADLAGAEVLA